jgi:hypothetical protein
MADLDRQPATAAVGRDAAAVIATFLVLGVLGGVLWHVLVTPAEFTRLARGGAMGEDELAKIFGADGWYAVIGSLAGLAAGLALSWWRSRDALLTSGLLVIGSAVAAVVMLLVGHLLGPGTPRAALAAAKVGSKVPERLDVDSFIVYLVWPVGALAGALFVLLGRAPEPGTPENGKETADSPSGARSAG